AFPPSVSQLRISSPTSWRGPSQVVHIKHEHNVGLVGNLAQLADVVSTRLLFHLAAPDRDTANGMSCMAVVDVSHASDGSVGLDAIIASLRRGSRVRLTGMDGKRTEYLRCRLCDEADALAPDLFGFCADPMLVPLSRATKIGCMLYLRGRLGEDYKIERDVVSS
ncbi:hypothetical protein EDB85DRAFT_1999333, partial [Lactarius pseudohatsudake]